MILEFNVKGQIYLDYSTADGDDYNELAENVIQLKDFNLDLTPFMRRVDTRKYVLLSHIYGAASININNPIIKLDYKINGGDFDLNGILTFTLNGKLPEVTHDMLIEGLSRFIEEMFDAEIEDIADVEALMDLIYYDYNISFRIDELANVSVTVKESKGFREDLI